MTEPMASGSGGDPAKDDGEWLDLETIAEIEITSEDPEYPIDSAIGPEGDGSGWHASNPGEQMIRVCFLEPQRLKLIRLVFEEMVAQRTQEFVLRWTSENPEKVREIVRQQYHFDPPDTTREVEDYNVNLDAVKMLELSIIPFILRFE